MKKLLIFSISLILIFSFTFTVSSYDYSDGRTSLVNDFADLLSDSDEYYLLQELEKLSEKYECEVSVLTVNTLDGQDITAFADDYFDYNGFGYGENDDGIMLVIDMETRQYATTTHAKAIEIFTDYNLDLIGYDIVPFLSNGYYYKAFCAFADTCAEILEDYSDYIGNPNYGTPDYPSANPGYSSDNNDYVYNNYNNQISSSEINLSGTAEIIIKSAIAAVIFGIIIAVVYTNSLKSKMKTVQRKPSAQDYVVPGSFNLTQNRDIFVTSKVTRKPIPKQNSSSGGGSRSSFGGGSSTHRSSSGRTHGGSRGGF